MQISPGIPTAAITLVAAFLIFAVLMGLLLGGQELLNPGLSGAKIRAMDAQTSQQRREWALDLEYQRKQRDQDLSAQQARQEIGLAILELGGLILVSALGFGVLAVGAGLTSYLVSLSRRELATVQLIRQQQLAGWPTAAFAPISASAMARSSQPPLDTAPTCSRGGNGHSGTSPPSHAQRQAASPLPALHRQQTVRGIAPSRQAAPETH